MRPFSTVLVLFLMLGVGSDLHAQEASTSDLEHELRTMVAEPTSVDRDREVVRSFLERGDVRKAAAGAGLDPERLDARLDALGDEALADLAEHVRDFQTEGDLVGGNTIIISGSTLIIVLLVLILVT